MRIVKFKKISLRFLNPTDYIDYIPSSPYMEEKQAVDTWKCDRSRGARCQSDFARGASSVLVLGYSIKSPNGILRLQIRAAWSWIDFRVRRNESSHLRVHVHALDDATGGSGHASLHVRARIHCIYTSNPF